MAAGASEQWPVKDIVYTSIVGVVMLMACLEWFLWLAAFAYCLVKVFQKAEHWSGALRRRGPWLRAAAAHLPAHHGGDAAAAEPGVAILAGRGRVVPAVVRVLELRGAADGALALLHLPAGDEAAGADQAHQAGARRRDGAQGGGGDAVLPRGARGAGQGGRLGRRLRLPGGMHPRLPELRRRAGRRAVPADGGETRGPAAGAEAGATAEAGAAAGYPRSIDVTYKAARVTVSRFAHGGKRHCQKATFRLIDGVYAEYLRRNDNLFILFIDSDCMLDSVCLQNFVYDMELSPGNARDMLAMTGVITSTTRRHSVITLLQDMEYIHGQLFERSVESGCGAVTCLPGALTMLRFSAFRRMAKYFADKAEQCDDLFDFAKCHLGEDRWLTHLFMIGAKKRHQIQMCPSAFCKTEAVQTYGSLVKQRRRWFLGFVTNEVCMLTDWRLWKRYPLLVAVRFMQNTIRTTALLFFVMALALLTTAARVDDLPVGFIAVSLGLNWLLMLYFGAKLRRFKIWLYPLMFVLNPFFNWYYMVYGIFTAGQRTWGGPRADAQAADGHTTAREAAEQAERQGDELNVVPETFKPAHEARRDAAAALPPSLPPSLPRPRPAALARRRSAVRAPDKIDGRFSARRRTATGLYAHPDETAAVRDAAASPPLMGPLPRWANWRDSLDSLASSAAEDPSPPAAPVQVDRFMGVEDRRKYAIAQQAQLQRPAQAAAAPLLPQGPANDVDDDDDNEWFIGRAL